MIVRSLFASLVTLALLPLGGSAYRRTEEGNRQYLNAQYDDALRAYTEAQVDRPESAELYYDIGNVLFRQNDFEGSAEAYTRALADAPVDLAGFAAFNLGNARFRQADYQAAVEAYQKALVADSTDLDAKRNLELALQALERQQQHQQQGQDEQPQNPEQQEQPEPEEQQPPEKPEEQPSPDSQPPQNDRLEPDPEQMMTAEQVERMLDGLEEQERENLRNQVLQQPRPTRRTSGVDW